MTRRADLASFSEEDLTRATNAGLVKRAKKELVEPSLSATFRWIDETIVVEWSDGFRCEFPPGQSIRGKCSCPADETCRHVVRSLLWLKNQPELLESKGPEPPPESIDGAPPPRAASRTTKSVPTVDELLRTPRPVLVKAMGKGTITRAEDFLRKHPLPSVVLEERRVTFPSAGLSVWFPPASVLTGAVCSCRETSPCVHAMAAMLLLRGEPAAIEDEAVDAEPVDHSHAYDRLQSLVDDLLVSGLDGLSSAWPAAAITTAIEIEKQGLEREAKSLDRLARQIDDQRTGARPFFPHVFRKELASLSLQLEIALSRASADAHSENEKRREELSLRRGPNRPVGRRSYVGVGARIWRNDEVLGITLYLEDVESGEIVTTSTARPIDRHPDAQSLARTPILAQSYSCRDLLGRAFVCRLAMVTEQGRLRVTSEEDIEIGASQGDWKEISIRRAVSQWDQACRRLREGFPSIVTGSRPDVQWFRPASMNSPTFDSRRQSLLWSMFDAEGRSLQLAYDYQPERAGVMEEIERSAPERQPAVVLAKLHLSMNAGAHTISAEPIALGYLEPEPRLWVIDLDPWEERRRGKR